MRSHEQEHQQQGHRYHGNQDTPGNQGRDDDNRFTGEQSRGSDRRPFNDRSQHDQDTRFSGGQDRGYGHESPGGYDPAYRRDHSDNRWSGGQRNAQNQWRDDDSRYAGNQDRFAGNQDGRGNQDRFAGNQDWRGGNQDRFAGNQDWRGGNQDWRGNQDRFAGNQDWRGNQDRFAGNQDRFTGNQDWRGNQDRFGRGGNHDDAWRFQGGRGGADYDARGYREEHPRSGSYPGYFGSGQSGFPGYDDSRGRYEPDAYGGTRRYNNAEGFGGRGERDDRRGYQAHRSDEPRNEARQWRDRDDDRGFDPSENRPRYH